MTRSILAHTGIGLAYGILIFGPAMTAAWGADHLFPPTVSELALVGNLGLSDGYASIATMVGILFLSVVATAVGFAIALLRRARISGSRSTPPP